MNEPNENTEPITVDELHDRLMDRALAEVVGGESRPDLSERILAAASPAQPSQSDSAHKTRRFPWIELAVAASLLVGASFLLLPAVHSARESSRASAKLNRSDSGPVSTSQDGHDESYDQADFKSRNAARESRESLLRRGEKSARIRPDASPVQLTELGDSEPNYVTPTTSPKTTAAKETPPESQLELVTSQTHAVPDDIGLLDLTERRKKFASVDLAGKPESSRSHVDLDAYDRPGRRAVELLERRLERKTLDASANVSRFNSRVDVLREINPPVPAGRAFARDFFARDDQPADGLDRAETDLGTGPGFSGDQYARIHENPFVKAVGGDAVSTFSIDVDTASYANVRQFLMDMNRLPPPDAVRIEELVNYFPYDYAGSDAEDETPFAAHVEVAGCPWEPEHRLVRIGIQGREIERDRRPTSNLVFLVDVSGSMNQPSKLPLVVQGLRQLTRELGENDRVAIVVYASREGLVLESTPGSEQRTILAALERLQAGGSTAGGAGIQLAYQIAEDHFITGGTNRVILCTDGDFNVGVTSTAELERLVEKKANETGVFLSVLGFGRGNLNDAMMETISGRGNGNYYYVDNRSEARKVLVEEMSGTLVTIAKDVKIQVEFNPRQVAGYRLIGYENRMLRTEDFNDDTKDAGEIGAGHAVTALYEVVPAGEPVDVPPVDGLKYQPRADSASRLRVLLSDGETNADNTSGELLTLKMRFKQPDGDVSDKREWPVTDDGQAFSAATTDFQFAASVAGFGLLLRDSEHKGSATWDAVLEIAESSQGADPHGYRSEFVELVRRAKDLGEVR